jgi:cysteine desulfurase
MLPFFRERYGNPSSMHSFGGSVEKEVRRARAAVAAMLGADHDYEITFTGTGTESDNLAILGATGYSKEKRHIITSAVEHPAVLNLCREMERSGYTVTYVPVDREGRLDMDVFRKSLDDDTAIVSIMYANNETGVIFPVEEIGDICRARKIPFHVDAVQAAGKIPIDVKRIKCDMLSLAGHKFHAPKGVGVLYVRRGTPLRPVAYGGHQEKGRRPGTENVPAIIGLGRAAELVMDHISHTGETARLRDRLESGLLARFSNAHRNGSKENRVPNTSNIGFEFIEGESILLYMDRKGIAASSGSACSSGSLEPSHVLRAMNIPFTAIHGSIRFSLSRFTTEEEIDYTLSVMPEVIEPLLEMSPFWDAEKKQGLPVTL